MSKYHTAEDGEWTEPTRRGFVMGCCDCGLVHRVNFRVRNRRIQMQVFRDNRKTAAIRRYLKRGQP